MNDDNGRYPSFEDTFADILQAEAQRHPVPAFDPYAIAARAGHGRSRFQLRFQPILATAGVVAVVAAATGIGLGLGRHPHTVPPVALTTPATPSAARTPSSTPTIHRGLGFARCQVDLPAAWTQAIDFAYPVPRRADEALRVIASTSDGSRIFADSRNQSTGKHEIVSIQGAVRTTILTLAATDSGSYTARFDGRWLLFDAETTQGAPGLDTLYVWDTVQGRLRTLGVLSPLTGSYAVGNGKVAWTKSAGTAMGGELHLTTLATGADTKLGAGPTTGMGFSGSTLITRDGATKTFGAWNTATDKPATVPAAIRNMTGAMDYSDFTADDGILLFQSQGGNAVVWEDGWPAAQPLDTPGLGPNGSWWLDGGYAFYNSDPVDPNGTVVVDLASGAFARLPASVGAVTGSGAVAITGPSFGKDLSPSTDTKLIDLHSLPGFGGVAGCKN